MLGDSHPANATRCPTCDADPETPCTRPGGAGRRPADGTPHARRITAAYHGGLYPHEGTEVEQESDARPMSKPRRKPAPKPTKEQERLF